MCFRFFGFLVLLFLFKKFLKCDRLFVLVVVFYFCVYIFSFRLYVELVKVFREKGNDRFLVYF